MANQLKMATIQSILSLHAKRWSYRRIARELGIDRETVSRYVGRAEQSAPAEPSGSGWPDSSSAPKSAIAPTGSATEPARTPNEPTSEDDKTPGPTHQNLDVSPGEMVTSSLGIGVVTAEGFAVRRFTGREEPSWMTRLGSSWKGCRSVLPT